MVQKSYKIQTVEQLNATTFRFVIEAPEIAKESWCGRFVNVFCDGKTLRRPISISQIDQANGTITLVFEIRGEGTKWLANRQAGESLNILGPLGNGFFPDNKKRGIFIGGGIGCPPMLGAAEAYGSDAEVILGFRSKEQLILLEDFQKVTADVSVTTNDGSYGTKGFVTDILKEKFTEDVNAVVYACGPMPMLRSVAELCSAFNVECYVSLEERMGCGIGACLACACQIQDIDGVHMLHVCKNGPVFNASKVVF